MEIRISDKSCVTFPQPRIISEMPENVYLVILLQNFWLLAVQYRVYSLRSHLYSIPKTSQRMYSNERVFLLNSLLATRFFWKFLTFIFIQRIYRQSFLPSNNLVRILLKIISQINNHYITIFFWLSVSLAMPS